MPLVEMLITGQKEKFLIHPVIEIFLKLKWAKTWKLYSFLVFLTTLFYVFLCGFALTHSTSENNAGKDDEKFLDIWW